MKIAIILGTRPEIIKMSPIIRECAKRNIDHFIIHTNQHYSDNMDKVFFENLNLPKPKYNLNVGSGSHGKQTGEMLERIEKVLIDEKPDMTIVQGDTNTVLAGALASSKIHIPISHIEAGLRSYDKRMPEETNRIITDRISDYLFVPTKTQKEILLKEGFEENRIFVVGNTIVDAVYQNIRIAEEKSKISIKLNLKKDRYILATSHRPENVDDKKTLLDIIKGLELIEEFTKFRIICPIHPRTLKNIEKFGINLPKSIEIIEPLDYLDFLWCEKNAAMIITDSGGIQEESCILKVPCITIRTTTERPETVDVGANIISGTDPEDILKAAKMLLTSERNWNNPFGNGDTSKKVLDLITER